MIKKIIFCCLLLLLPVSTKAFDIIGINSLDELRQGELRQEEMLGAITYRFWHMVSGSILQPASDDWTVAFNNDVAIIGDTTMTGDLDVSGSLTAQDITLDGNVRAQINVGSGDGTGTTTLETYTLNDSFLITTEGNASTSPAILVTTANRVGFSTTTPWAYLSVEGQGTNPSFAVSDTTNNTDFIVDATGQVGIATTTPGALFSVAGAGLFSNQLTADNFVADSTTATSTFAGGLTIQTNKFVVQDDSGNIGIGTDAPSQLLHIEKNQDTGTYAKIVNTNTHANTLTGFQLISDDSLLQLFALHDGYGSSNNELKAGYGIVTGSNNGLILAASGATEMEFWTNSNERMTIDSAGNVGIGNTAPGNELEVSDSASSATIEVSTWSTTDGNKSDIVLQKSSSATINTLAVTAADEDLGGIWGVGVNTSSATGNATQILFEGDAAPDADAVPGRMLFKTSDAVSLKESFRVDDSQNVLIADGNGLVVGGLAQQTVAGGIQELQVVGTAAADSRMLLGRWSADVSAPLFTFSKSRDGTIGSFTIVENGDDLGIIGFYADDGNDLTSQAASILAKVDDASPASNQIGGALVFATSATDAASVTEAMRIDSGQRVGIGTSTPRSILHVDSGTTSTTTVEIGDQFSGTGHTCFEGANSSGAVFSFYFNASNVMQIEDKACVE